MAQETNIVFLVLKGIILFAGAGYLYANPQYLLIALIWLNWTRITSWANDARWWYIPRTEDDILFDEYKKMKEKMEAAQAQNK